MQPHGATSTGNRPARTRQRGSSGTRPPKGGHPMNGLIYLYFDRIRQENLNHQAAEAARKRAFRDQAMGAARRERHPAARPLRDWIARLRLARAARVSERRAEA